MHTAKTSTRNGITAVRCYPSGSLFLTALLASLVVCYVMFVSVSIQLIPLPPAVGALPVFGRPAAGSVQGHRDSAAGPGLRQQVSVPAPSSAPAVGASAQPSASASGGASVAVPSQFAANPLPLSLSLPVPSPSPGPVGPSPAPSPSGSDPGGLCEGAGPSGMCLPV
jgi:hypothetical protein